MAGNHSNDIQKRESFDDDAETEGSIKSNNSVKSSPPRPATPSSSSEEPTTTAPDGYDPKRIPSSVFASKSGKGIDWSNASQESLFSIYMGNNSLSRDQIAMMYKSGELPMLDQEYSSNQPPPGASTWQPPLPPSSPLRRNAPINIVHVHVHVPSNNNNDGDNSNNNFATTTIPPEVALPPTSPPAVDASSTPAVTRNSTTSSTRSFQFPIFPQEQMERSTPSGKVEVADRHSEKKKVGLGSEEVRSNEEKTTSEGEKQSGEQQMTAEKGSPWKKCCGSWSSWFSCLPCFSKPNHNSPASSS